MKGVVRNSRWLTVAVLIAFTASPSFAARNRSRTATARSSITARAAILLDNQTGEVLWERNPDLQLPPASTTKVLTAMVALRSGRLDNPVLISEEAAREPASKVYLRAGWRVRMIDLVYAIMLNSANDASVAIAEGIAGSVPAFAERMNAQAHRWGAVNSHFVNPNGLPDSDHYSTARDLATLFSVAARDPLFDQIVSTESIPIIPAEGSVRTINLRTHNRLLTNYQYEVIGKTGWTIAAKRCFVGAARANGREIIVAVLGSRDLWGDVRKLIEFGFDGSSRPEVEMARAEADEVSPASRAAGDEDNDDDATAYSGRTSRVLHASKRAASTASAKPARPDMRRAAARTTLAGESKKQDTRKRKGAQLARRASQQQSTRVAKATRPATRSASVAHAAKVPAQRATKERSRTQSKSARTRR